MYKLNIIKDLVRPLVKHVYVNEKRWSIFSLLSGSMKNLGHSIFRESLKLS